MRKTLHDRIEARTNEMIEKIFPGGEILNLHISNDRFFNVFVRYQGITYELKYGRAEHIEFRKRNMAGRPLYSVWASVYLDNKLITDSPVFTSCVDVEEDHDLFIPGEHSEVIDEAVAAAIDGACKNLDELGKSVDVAKAALSK